MKKALLRKNQAGFTLIELVVVMAIIAVLSTLIIAAITAARRQSVNTERTGTAKTVEVALESWATKNGNKYPVSTYSFNTMVDKLVADNALTGYPNGINVSGGVASGNAVYAYKADTNGTSYTLAVCDHEDGTAAITTAGVATVTGCTGSTAYVTTR